MNVLFIGLGGIGQRHLRNLVSLKLSDLHIYAYRVRKASFVLGDKLLIEEGKNLEEQYSIKVFDTLDEAWEHSIDVAFICNPTSLHRETLLQVMRHVRGIFIEKPIAEGMEGLAEIADWCKRNNVVTFIGYQNRFHPCIEKAKKLLSEKMIGRVISVNAEIGEDVRKWHKYEDYRQMYACRKDLGGGVVLSQIHELDYIPYLLSEIPETVYAIGGKLSDLEIDVEDVASIVMKFNVCGEVIPVHLYEDYIQYPPSRCCKIIGTRGRIEFDLLNAEIVCYGEDGDVVFSNKYDFSRNDMFLKEMDIFLNAVLHREASNIDIYEGMKSLRIAEAVKASLATGKVVRIQEG